MMLDPNDRFPVILFGFGSKAVGERLEELLSDAGLDVRRAENLSSLSSLLATLPGAAVALFASRTGLDPNNVLDLIERTLHGTPIIVLVDHADFSEYHAFMQRGVVGYFETQEPASMICSAVMQAPRRAGAF